MKKANIIFGCIFILFAVTIILFTLNTFPPSVNGVPGPSLFPILVSIVMILSALLIIFHYLRLKEDEPINWLADDTKRAYLSMLMIAVYLLLIPIIGFYVVSFVFLVGIIRWFRKKDFAYTAGVSAVILGFVYVVFSIFLRVPLDLGILF